MKNSKNPLENSIDEIKDYNHSINTPGYFIRNNRNLIIKNLSKSKLGLVFLGLIGFIYSFILLVLNFSILVSFIEVIKVMAVLIISILLLIKGVKLGSKL